MDTPPLDDTHHNRRTVLSEIRVSDRDEESPNIPESYVTPPTSPDELIIQKRGQRRIPVTWSPVDIKKMTSFTSPQNTTPQKTPPIELRRSLRKRLILSPGKNPARNLSAQLNIKKILSNDKLNVSFP